MNPETQLHCVGYFGFGGGYQMIKVPPQNDQALYCNECPLKGQCWEKHKQRVRQMFPELVEVMDRLIARGLRGEGLIRAYATFAGVLTGQDPTTIAPPEIHVMTGNIEDGMRVAEEVGPADRGRFTLRFPFES